MHTAHIFFQNAIPSSENSVDPDQMASKEASWSGSTQVLWWIYIDNGIEQMNGLKSAKLVIKLTKSYISYFD